MDPSDKRPFIAFLEAHPALETLSLSKYNVPPQHLSSIDPGSLHITSFTGTLQQLQALPYLRTHLKSVTFRDSMLTREVSTQAISVLLQSLSNLTELKIAFILHSMYDSGNLLRSLIIACPRLRQLDLTCGNKPSFQMVCPWYLSLTNTLPELHCRTHFPRPFAGFLNSSRFTLQLSNIQETSLFLPELHASPRLIPVSPNSNLRSSHLHILYPSLSPFRTLLFPYLPAQQVPSSSRTIVTASHSLSSAWSTFGSSGLGA